MYDKYVMSIPLYRQEQEFRRLGIPLSRQTLSNWCQRGVDWLEHIHTAWQAHLLRQDVLYADETHLQVLREPGRSPTTKSYMWLYATGPIAEPVVVFDYQQTRGAVHPLTFLEGFAGYLHVDGYAGYECLDATLVGCWSHARRYFTDALALLQRKAPSGFASTLTEEGLIYVNGLFDVERALRHLPGEERYAARQAWSVPILHEFRAWLERHLPGVLRQSLVRRAMNYSLGQ